MNKESPIFTQTYDLLRWLLPLVGQLPREHRSGLARRLPDVAFELQRLLIQAAKAEHATTQLRAADASLAELRTLLRLTRDLGAISFGQYEEGVRRSGELVAYLVVGCAELRSCLRPPGFEIGGSTDPSQGGAVDRRLP